jgi:Holliday junction resolvase RusA-like endonuclease
VRLGEDGGRGRERHRHEERRARVGLEATVIALAPGFERPSIPLRIVIPGKPFAWRRARTFGARHFEDPEQRAWKGVAQVHMLEACAGRGRPVFPEGPVEIVIRAFWPPPGQPRKRIPRPARWRSARPDADNTFKALADCSQGILVSDDGQYARVVVEKWFAAQGDPARVEVEVRRLVEGP